MRKTGCILLVLFVIFSLSIPAFAAEDAVVEVPAADAMLGVFPAFFEGLTSLFESPPILYLFGIYILAFIILIFRVLI